MPKLPEAINEYNVPLKAVVCAVAPAVASVLLNGIRLAV